jgi:hypothetical protein
MAEKWIQKAIGKPGALRKQLKIKKGEPIPSDKLATKKSDTAKTKARKNLAKTLKNLNK